MASFNPGNYQVGSPYSVQPYQAGQYPQQYSVQPYQAEQYQAEPWEVAQNADLLKKKIMRDLRDGNENTIAIMKDVKSMHLQENSIESLSQCANTLQTIAEKTNSVYYALCEINKSLNGPDFYNIDRGFRDFLISEYNLLNASHVDLNTKVNELLRTSLLKYQEKYTEVQKCYLTASRAYLVNRNPEDLIKARDFRYSFYVLYSSSNKLMEIMREREVPIDFKDYSLMSNVWMGPFSEPIEFVLQELDCAIEKKYVGMPRFDGREGVEQPGQFAAWEKRHINNKIKWIDQQIGYDAVNYWVWKLAGEQSGENWGFVHRYDDLGILKQAVLKASEEIAEKIFENEAKGLDRQRILQRCYENLGQPALNSIEPIEWMDKNIHRYPQALRDAIIDVRFQERGFNRLNVYEQLILQRSIRDGSWKSNLPGLPSSLYEHGLLLADLDRLADSQQVISSELKSSVEKLIENLTRRGHLDTINWLVWSLSKASDKSGENWGEVHRYDDLKVLREALMVAIQKDFDQCLVNVLENPEDQKAFYEEIGRMHHARNPASSAPNFEELGKQYLALYLHRVADFYDAVKWQHKMQDLRNNPSFDMTLPRIIEYAIHNNPRAQQLTSLMELIQDADKNEALKEKIKKIVESADFPDDFREMIFLEIWRKAGEPQGNPNFGKDNYLNDYHRLYLVLDRIISNIALGFTD